MISKISENQRVPKMISKNQKNQEIFNISKIPKIPKI